VGDRFKITSLNYVDIDLEFEIAGELPGGRFESSAIMNVSYLRNALKGYERSKGFPHPAAARGLCMVWLRAVDKEAAKRLIKQIEESPRLVKPSVRCLPEEEAREKLKAGVLEDPK
jgi:hypothetical protein